MIPEERGIGDKFFFEKKSVWSTEPCQLPLTIATFCLLLVKALEILIDFITLSEPVVQKIKLCVLLKYFLM